MSHTETTVDPETGEVSVIERKPIEVIQDDETAKVSIEVIITTVDSETETKILTQTITVTEDKATGKTAKKSKKSSKTIPKDELEIGEDGVTNVTDEESGLPAVREKITTVTETDEAIITVIVVTWCMSDSHEDNDMERVITHTLTITYEKESGQTGKKKHKHKRTRRRRRGLRFSKHLDKLEAVGFTSTNLIIGIDFTKSNRTTGYLTFGKKNLHTLDENIENPYQAVIRIIGESLQDLTGGASIPVLCFGDAKSHAKRVVNLFEGGFAKDYEEVLAKYKEFAPTIDQSGPTSFAPLIKKALEIQRSTGKHNTLVIICDGHVSEGKEEETAQALIEAAASDLAVVMVGVGDGPWDLCRGFTACPWRITINPEGKNKWFYYNESENKKSWKAPEEYSEYRTLPHTPVFLPQGDKDTRRFNNFFFIEYTELDHRFEKDEVAWVGDMFDHFVHQHKVICPDCDLGRSKSFMV